MGKTFSVEDGNLNASTIIGSRSVKYKDIDLTFTNKAVSGEIFRKEDAAAVKQAVKNLILTNFAEKPFKPNFGGNLRALLFDLADADAKEDIEDNINTAISKYEPRVSVIRTTATVNPDRNAVDVTILFQVINTQQEVSLSIVLARLR